MHPNTMKCTETLVFGPMGWIGCVRCEKSRRDFVARTFALIAQVPPFCTEFLAVTKRSQMHPNTTKQTEILVLGPMGWIGCAFVTKNHDVIRGTDFCVNCSSSPRFAPSFLQLQNNPKCTQTLWNTPKHNFRVQWGRSGAFVVKNTMWLRGTYFCINWTSIVCFAPSFMQ